MVSFAQYLLIGGISFALFLGGCMIGNNGAVKRCGEIIETYIIPVCETRNIPYSGEYRFCLYGIEEKIEVKKMNCEGLQVFYGPQYQVCFDGNKL